VNSTTRFSAVSGSGEALNAVRDLPRLLGRSQRPPVRQRDESFGERLEFLCALRIFGRSSSEAMT
jgi:hypothetical protein